MDTVGDGGLQADGVLIRTLGRDGEPLAVLLVEVRLQDGSFLELGREPLAPNFISFLSLNPQHLQALRDGTATELAS